MSENNSNPKNWVALNRSILDWEWFSDHIMFKVFVGLLLMAGYESRCPNGIDLERGQALISRKKVSEKLGVTERQFRTAMAKLVKTGEIKVKATNKFSIVTICKYDSYQHEAARNDQQKSDQQNDQQNVRQTTSKTTSRKEQLTLYPLVTYENRESENDQRLRPINDQQNVRQTTTVNKDNNITREHMSGACEQAPDGSRGDGSENLPEKQSAKNTPDDPIILTYPVVGKNKTWGLNKSKRDEYIEIYQDAAFVDHALKDALQWLRDNPSRRKTPGGMTKFLGGWIRRNWDRSGGTRQEAAQITRQPEPRGWQEAYRKLREQYPQLDPLKSGDSYHSLTPFAREEITNILKAK